MDKSLLNIYQKKMLRAQMQTNKSVIKINESAYDNFKKAHIAGQKAYYIGAKDTQVVKPLIEKLQQHHYYLHTLDKASYNGRAIDIDLVNPLTARIMTGSSSGSAINVFYGINDVGVGTDGGGSVLAPAMSLNLFAFISPMLPVQKVAKTSTDGQQFTPASGIITQDLNLLKKTVEIILDDKLETNFEPQILEQHQLDVDIFGPRSFLISWLEQKLEEFDIIISHEGPIDVQQYGDTLQGCFSSKDTLAQKQSAKGLLRVVNMAKATAITVPRSRMAEGTLIICKTDKKAIAAAFKIAQTRATPFPKIIVKYFHQSYLIANEGLEWEVKGGPQK
ncbi:MAG: amidase family protein [Culicoidibacterales bacterium]